MPSTIRGLDLRSDYTDILSFSVALQRRYEAESPPAVRRRQGQVFTPASVARFMAGLFSTFPRHLKVLDPGAGTGTLSAAVCERILGLRAPRQIEFCLFETDPTVLRLLDINMQNCCGVLRHAGHKVSYEIRPTDFILSNARGFDQGDLFGQGALTGGFDAVIMNPPYFKIPRNSPYAQMMDNIVHGQPNIYALFMALSAALLRSGGELVAITPRSFCGGLYFRGFRRWFFGRMSLRHIHLFESRSATFARAQILQENVITVTRRHERRVPRVTISTSFGANLSPRPSAHQVPIKLVIDDTCGDAVIRIPENPLDAEIMEAVESWPTRFTDHELRVSTGPVVPFRATAFLSARSSLRDHAPLLSTHNVHPFKTLWPLEKKGKPSALRICSESLGRRLLVPRRNYVLLRRFSAKEERRRLTASCYLKEASTCPYLAIENHLNYVTHATRELTTQEIYGLAALYNSALLDRYFRSISGNTQVNAVELRTMRFPGLALLSHIGERILEAPTRSPLEVECIVLDELGVDGRLGDYLRNLAS